MVKISDGTLDVREIAFNMNDHNVFTVMGKKTFKCYKQIETRDDTN